MGRPCGHSPSTASPRASNRSASATTSVTENSSGSTACTAARNTASARTSLIDGCHFLRYGSRASCNVTSAAPVMTATHDAAVTCQPSPTSAA